MAKIRVLSDLLVNKIAAGEVIERPASVVKELVENAVDAGSSRVHVTIEDGGRQLIRIVDDGEGMSAEDLRLAVTPHATSKITDEEDLFAIATMGFRGEALASIGAVSQMQIRSRQLDSMEGHEILVVGERIELSRATGCPVGTQIEVRDLFFNVPARRKFLRGASTEAGHVNEQFTRIALPNPQVAFELTNNTRTTQKLAITDNVRERIGKLFSNELADDLIPIEWEERGLRISGFVAPPSRTRANANWQYTFLNGRYIRDRFVQHAIKEAYRGLIDPTRSPVVFLFFTIDPAAVDVNVHPTKIEVRWQDSNLVHSQVLASLREKFQRTDLTPSLSVPDSQADPGRQSYLEQQVREKAAGLMRGIEPTIGYPAQPRSGGDGHGSGNSPVFESVPDRGTPGQAGALWKTFHTPARRPVGDPQQDLFESQSQSLYSKVEILHPDKLRVMQVHNSFLVAEVEDGIVVIDQHALHERVLYEKFKKKIAEGKLESQQLLLPETIAVRATEMGLIEEHADLLEKLGLSLSAFGPETLAVQAIPAAIRDTDVTSFVRDLLDRLNTPGQETTVENVLEDLLAMMACKAAIKAGDPLTDDEICSLLEFRGAVDKYTNCPHGRPTTLHFSRSDLEKQFKRT